jgi:hypothetical protein
VVISPGWYPNLGEKPEYPSVAFQRVLDWLVANGAPEPQFEMGGSYGAPFGGLRGPDQIRWRKAGKPDVLTDAVLTFLNPSTALAELESHFGFGNPSVVKPYVREIPAPPPVVFDEPIPAIILPNDQMWRVGQEIPGTGGQMFYLEPGAPLANHTKVIHPEHGRLTLYAGFGVFWKKVA